MRKILLMGAGKIGEMITVMLSQSGDYHVTVADISETALAAMPKGANIETLKLNATDADAMDAALNGMFAVLSACPFTMSKYIAPAAKRAGAHYFDLTEDVESTRMVKELAEGADCAFVPQCGLAPGFITIVAWHLTKKFDSLRNVHMRVGALPQMPSNAMKYNLTWSTDGLINEFLQPCEAILGGENVEVPPLEQLETITIDGAEYEAFNTSGGLGTLCETLSGKVQNLNYRTIRYPGHRDILKLLLQDMRLGEDFDLAKQIFEKALPVTKQDVVLIFVNVTGEKNGQFMQESYAHKVYAGDIAGGHHTGIQITTAAGICAMVDLMADGKLPSKGFVKQEDCDFEDFIANRFGSHYAKNNAEGGAQSIAAE